MGVDGEGVGGVGGLRGGWKGGVTSCFHWLWLWAKLLDVTIALLVVNICGGYRLVASLLCLVTAW